MNTLDIEKINLIKSTFNDLFKFIETSEKTKSDFNDYICTLGLKNTYKNNLEETCIPYIFERQLPDEEKNIIELFLAQNNLTKDKKTVVEALNKTISSIFKIKRVLKNGFELYNLTNERTYSAISLTKMNKYKGVGTGQFVVARIFELDGTHYIAEISGILPTYKKDEAVKFAIAKIMQEPQCAYFDNEEKIKSIQENIAQLHKKFVELFNSDKVITTNKLADEIIDLFHNYCETEIKPDLTDKIQELEQYKFVDVPELNSNYTKFLDNSTQASFASHKTTYDVGIILDKNSGLNVIPFYKTLCKILQGEDIENKEQCIEFFKNGTLLTKTILERLKNYHEFDKYFDSEIKHEKDSMFSETTLLYNSKVFKSMIDDFNSTQELENIDYNHTGRNELCPCGSGKKFKNCCMTRFA